MKEDTFMEISDKPTCIDESTYIYIYIYICVCVCVCVYNMIRFMINYTGVLCTSRGLNVLSNDARWQNVLWPKCCH
jgi:hypothetical protein